MAEIADEKSTWRIEAPMPAHGFGVQKRVDTAAGYRYPPPSNQPVETGTISLAEIVEGIFRQADI